MHGYGYHCVCTVDLIKSLAMIIEHDVRYVTAQCERAIVT